MTRIGLVLYENVPAETLIAEKLTSVSEKLGAYERGGGDQLCRGSEDMLEDLHEIDTASILDEPRVFNAIACKTRFGPKADPLVTLASSVGSLLAPSSSVGSITPRSPLATPKNSQIDLLLADRSNFAESENLQQVFTCLLAVLSSFITFPFHTFFFYTDYVCFTVVSRTT